MTLKDPEQRGAELLPAKKNDWIRAVRRCRLGPGTKYVALMLTTYSDGDGSRIYPGRDLLALVTEKSSSTVDRALKDLRTLGLIVRVTKGSNAGRRAQADVYQLTTPSDLEHACQMLDPDERPREHSAWVTTDLVEQSAPMTTDPARSLVTHDDRSTPPEPGSLVTSTPEHSSKPADHSSPMRRSLVMGDDLPDQDQPLPDQDHAPARALATCARCEEPLRSPTSQTTGLCPRHRGAA